MALNMATFRTRTLTAAVFAAVMLFGLFWNQWSFFILFTIIHFGCWTEYQRLVDKIDPEYKTISPFHRYGVQLAGWSLMLFFAGRDFMIGDFELSQAGLWMGLIGLFILPIVELLFARQIKPKLIAQSALGLAYISLSWGLLINLYQVHIFHVSDVFYVIPPIQVIILMIASIWINDTMAYIVGSMIGRRPLSAISPKKTWEGTVGGVLLSVGVLSVWAYQVAQPFLLLPVAIIVLIASVMGTIGDLLESKLKRMAGVKDSGSFMPGHGGFLDRFDSIIFATPFVWLFVQLFKAFFL